MKHLLRFAPLLMVVLVADATRGDAAENFCKGAEETIAAHATSQPVAHHRGPWSNPEQVPGFVPPKIESYDDLLSAFRNGLIPNFNDQSQKSAFEIYRTSRFGDPKTELNGSTWDELARIQFNHPDLTKEIFRNYQVTSINKYYSVTPELEKFLNANAESNGLIRATLDTSGENKNYWQNLGKKITVRDAQGRPAGSKVERLLSDADIERLQKIGETHPATRERDHALFQALKELRDRGLKEGKDVKPLSQAMANIVHNSPFQNDAIKAGLKSTDGMKRLRAFSQALTDRAEFLQEEKMTLSYPEFLKELKVSKATGVMDEPSFAKQLARLQQDLETAGVQATEAQQSTVRHLSIAESPFRSCIGGTDCSSRTYLTKALDPNYHYFAWTDSEGYSSGHITVVLGTAGEGPGATHVAFVDKIQNVPNERIPVFLESIRQSVAEKGYTLAIPEDVGGHNGMSNIDETLRFVARDLKTYTQQKERLPAFHPHANPLSKEFKNLYSRAEDRLPVVPLLPLEAAPGAEIQAGAAVPNWSTGHIDVNALIQHSISLKNGTLDDQLRYISSMGSLKAIGVTGDPEFSTIVQAWAKDSTIPVKLRNRALGYLLRAEPKRVPELLSALPLEERANIIQNWWQTPSLQTFVSWERKDLLPLIKGTEIHNEIWLKFANPDEVFLALMEKPIPGNHSAAELREYIRQQAHTNSPELKSMADAMETYAEAHGMSFFDVDAIKILSEWSEDLEAGRSTRLTQTLSGKVVAAATLTPDFATELASKLGPKAKKEVIAAVVSQMKSESTHYVGQKAFERIYPLALGDPESLDLLLGAHRAPQAALEYGMKEFLKRQPGPGAAGYGSFFEASVRQYVWNLRESGMLDKVYPLMKQHYPDEFASLVQQVAKTVNEKLTAHSKEALLNKLMERTDAYVPDLVAPLLLSSDRDGIQYFQSVWMTEFQAKYPAQAAELQEELAVLKPARLVQRTPPYRITEYETFYANPQTLVDHSRDSQGSWVVNWITDTGTVTNYKLQYGIQRMTVLPDGSVLTLRKTDSYPKTVYEIQRLKDRKLLKVYKQKLFEETEIYPLGHDKALLIQNPEPTSDYWRKTKPLVLDIKSGKISDGGLFELVRPLEDGSLLTAERPINSLSPATIRWIKDGVTTGEVSSGVPLLTHDLATFTPISPDEVVGFHMRQESLTDVIWCNRSPSGMAKTFKIDGQVAGYSRDGKVPLHDKKTLFVETYAKDAAYGHWLRDGKLVASLKVGLDGILRDAVVLADDTIVVKSGNHKYLWVREGKVLSEMSLDGAEKLTVASDGRTVLAMVNGMTLTWMRDGKILRMVNTDIHEGAKIFVFPNGKALLTGTGIPDYKPYSYSFDALEGLPPYR